MSNVTNEQILAELRRLRSGPSGLVRAEEIAAWASVSKSTVLRKRRECGIKWRNVHGGRWTEGDGTKRISMKEWKGAAPLDTRSVKSGL